MASTSAGNENDSAEAGQMRPDIVNPTEEAQVEACVEVVAGLRQLVFNREFSDYSAVFAQMRPNIVQQAEKKHVEASAELVAGLRQMVNNPDFSDVTFLCNDGKQVRASRVHLAARSDVLNSLLMNGMAKSNLAEIKLPAVSSPVMLSVLEFLYTGSLLDYPLQSWKMGWDVITASRFFLLPKLEIIVRKFMHAEVVGVAQDLPGAATLLTEAVGFKVFCDQTDDNLRELVTILRTNWSDSVFVQNLSEEAFQYLLINTSCNFEDDDILSFREYLRFRQVIQWWIYQSNLGSHSKEELMSFLTPNKERVMSICDYPEILEKVESPKEEAVRLLSDWNSLQSDEAPKAAAIRLLSNIDYRSIHPVVLAKVVEPLKISSGEIVNAFRFHALRRPMLEYRWNHHQSYRTFERGHVIYRIGETTGLAVIEEGIILSSRRVYEWELVVEEDCSLFAELGLVSTPFINLDKTLSDHDFAWVLKLNAKETKVCKRYSSPNATATWTDLQAQRCYPVSRVSFILDTIKKTCCISINGQDFGLVWNGFISKSYYPAVSFGTCRRGRIRANLVRGFDIL